MSKAEDYRKGGEGFIQWVEENVRLSVFPEGSDIPQWMSFPEFPPKIRDIAKEMKEIGIEAKWKKKFGGVKGVGTGPGIKVTEV